MQANIIRISNGYKEDYIGIFKAFQKLYLYKTEDCIFDETNNVNLILPTSKINSFREFNFNVDNFFHGRKNLFTISLIFTFENDNSIYSANLNICLVIFIYLTMIKNRFSQKENLLWIVIFLATIFTIIITLKGKK